MNALFFATDDAIWHWWILTLSVPGIVQGAQGIRQAFAEGKGRIIVRSRVRIEQTKSLTQIIVYEIPYEVVKSSMVRKIDEIRLVDRAKCALIQYLSMTEAQAHRYIEKQAMDRRTTRGRVAQSIIEIYEQ